MPCEELAVDRQKKIPDNLSGILKPPMLSERKAEKAADAFLFAGLSKCGRAADVREISAALQRTAELLKDMERAANFSAPYERVKGTSTAADSPATRKNKGKRIKLRL